MRKTAPVATFAILWAATAALGFGYGCTSATPGAGPTGSATSTSTSATPPPGDGGPPSCWSLPTVTRVRFFPRAGAAASMVGGTFVGSNESETNRFSPLVTITAAPAEGKWTELAIPSPVSYRFVKYFGAPGTHGDIAEIELYAGANKLDGLSFGTVSPSPDHGNAAAFDGDTSTYYDGTEADYQYVGKDLAGLHLVAAPVLSPTPGRFATPQSVSITSATSGATIHYSTDGSDPATNGAVYSGPITVSKTSVVSAVATHDCLFPSPVTTSLYAIGTPNKDVQSSMHLGNSLSEWDVVPLMLAGTSRQLAQTMCLGPGVGTVDIWKNDGTKNPGPGCDLGVADPKATLQSQPFDNLTLQPFADEPCLPGAQGGDAEYIEDFFQLAHTTNAETQVWVYETWPQPTPGSLGWSLLDCFSGHFPDLWTPPAPTSDWDSAMDNHIAYHEAVRDALAGVMPAGAKAPLIVPAGPGLKALKAAIEGGQVPGQTDFFSTVFGNGGTDLHLTTAGRYMVGCIIFSVFFQTSPEGLGVADSQLTKEQATVYQQIAWQAALSYKYSGLQ